MKWSFKEDDITYLKDVSPPLTQHIFSLFSHFALLSFTDIGVIKLNAPKYHQSHQFSFIKLITNIDKNLYNYWVKFKYNSWSTYVGFFFLF